MVRHWRLLWFAHFLRATTLRPLPPLPDLRFFEFFATECHLLPFLAAFTWSQMVTLALVPGPATCVHQAWADAVRGGVLEMCTRSPLVTKAPGPFTEGATAAEGETERPSRAAARAIDVSGVRRRME